MPPGPQTIRIAFQGEAGAFSDEAARGAFERPVETLPCRTFEDMFDAVTSGAADAAMAPIENTLMGSIIKNYDLLAEHQLEICAEVILRIVHNLIAPPGRSFADIRRVLSHPVALAQCERFLHDNPQIAVESAYDTAGSVKLVMERSRPGEAAIAGATAAAVYGAAILKKGIESHTQNYTRFLVLRPPRDAAEKTTDLPLRKATTALKTSIVFWLANRPGCLYEALSGFAAAGVDLTKIESRPIEGKPFEYSFYLDFAGSVDDPAVDEALKRLRPATDLCRVLGSYPKVRIG